MLTHCTLILVVIDAILSTTSVTLNLQACTARLAVITLVLTDFQMKRYLPMISQMKRSRHNFRKEVLNMRIIAWIINLA